MIVKKDHQDFTVHAISMSAEPEASPLVRLADDGKNIVVGFTADEGEYPIASAGQYSDIQISKLEPLKNQKLYYTLRRKIRSGETANSGGIVVVDQLQIVVSRGNFVRFRSLICL